MSYGMQEYFRHRFDENYRKYGFKGSSIEEHKKWKEEIKERLTEITGFDKMLKCEFNAEVTESVEFEKYKREKIIISTQPYVKMPFFVLTPKENNNIAAIAIHGHGSDGKNFIAGIESEELANSKKYNYTYGTKLVEQGYVVFIPDLCASGERREPYVKDITKTSCNDVNNAAISLGMSLCGIILWDLIRLVDYIKENYKFDDIYSVGFSGGGLYGLWLSAFDDRISSTVVSGYFHGLKDTILANNFCGCNFVPGLWETIDICDLGSMIAPRRLAVEVGNEDGLNGERGLDNFYEMVEETKKAYKLYDETQFKDFVGEGKHQWYGLAYDFMKIRS